MHRAELRSFALAVFAIGCARRPATPTPSAETARCAFPSAPLSPPRDEYRYRVAAAPRGEELCVEVDVPKSAALPWAPEGPLSPFVRDVVMDRGGSYAPITARGAVWEVPACRADRGCRLRYRVKLDEAADKLDDVELAEKHRGAILAPPSSWLLRPMKARGRFRAEVITPQGTGFLTGLARDPSGVYLGDVGDLDDTPYAVFGPLSRRSIAVRGGEIDLATAPGSDARAMPPAIAAWVEQSARAVADYFDGFPIPRAAILVKLVPGKGAGSGHTMGGGGGAIVIEAGESSTSEDFAGDWILVHEMLHLAFPDVRRPWAEEGLSTYVEPLVRARADLCSIDEVWRSLLEGLPKGQPEPGDRGLDESPSWGRRYWGGAMFWLLADVEIRRKTNLAKGLEDALRAVIRQGGNVSVRWNLDRALAVGDAAIGVEVLRPLRQRLGARPERVDLEALFKGLGVSLRDGRVAYDEAAPFAHVRRAITAKPKAALR